MIVPGEEDSEGEEKEESDSAPAPRLALRGQRLLPAPPSSRPQQAPTWERTPSTEGQAQAPTPQEGAYSMKKNSVTAKAQNGAYSMKKIVSQPGSTLTGTPHEQGGTVSLYSDVGTDSEGESGPIFVSRGGYLPQYKKYTADGGSSICSDDEKNIATDPLLLHPPVESESEPEYPPPPYTTDESDQDRHASHPQPTQFAPSPQSAMRRGREASPRLGPGESAGSSNDTPPGKQPRRNSPMVQDPQHLRP